MQIEKSLVTLKTNKLNSYSKSIFFVFLNCISLKGNELTCFPLQIFLFSVQRRIVSGTRSDDMVT